MHARAFPQGLKQASAPQLFLWILCLALLSVGARNFETGLSTDGPLYGAIARYIAQSGEWFRLSGLTEDFQPYYAEHPHLGFWLQALVFKVLPAADWSLRILGHLFYVAFLWLFYRWMERKEGETAATVGVLLLWTWPVFANFHSTGYLDPGALFLGALGLFLLDAKDAQSKHALGAGLAFALCVLYKGLTAAGFVPLYAWLLCRRPQLWIPFLATLFAPLIAYAAALSQSDAADFLSLYWRRQMTQRFSGMGLWPGLLYAPFWKTLLKDTHGLLLLLPFLLFRVQTWRRWTLPVLWFLCFAFIYAAKFRVGRQYWLMIMPPLAWILSAWVAPYLEGRAPLLKRASFVIALVGLFVVQYIPLRTHGQSEAPALKQLLLAKEREQAIDILADFSTAPETFALAGTYAWYTGLPVRISPSPAPSAQPRTLFVVWGENPARSLDLRQSGWCLLHKAPAQAEYWAACPQSGAAL